MTRRPRRTQAKVALAAIKARRRFPNRPGGFYRRDIGWQALR